MGYDNDDVFHHPLLKRVIDGIKRMRGEKDLLERRPITRDVLLSILATLDQSTLIGATLHASFCLAFAAFLRIGEFTWNSGDVNEEFASYFAVRRSVTLHDDHLEFSLPSSKTDPFRRGVTITVAAANDDACAIRSLRHLFTAFPAAATDPLFFPGKPFTRYLVTNELRKILRQLGLEGHYSGHSFRRGAATSARESGLAEHEIQLLGRWKSDSYKLYIVANPTYILNASRRHQQATRMATSNRHYPPRSRRRR